MPQDVADVFEDFDPTLCDLHGRDACEDPACLPPEVGAAAAAPPRPRLRVLRADDVMTLPSPAEIIEGVLWQGCITLLPAESGSGKTFVVLDQGGAVSAGAPWHGRQTVRGSAVYVGYEGDDLRTRFRALRDVQGYDLAHVHVIRASEPISPRVTREGEIPSVGELLMVETLAALRAELAATNRPPIRLVIIDTARASMNGSEDSSEHASAYLRAVRRLMATVPEAGCLITHHTGWQDGGDTQRKRERGSSAWRGNVDATLYLEAGEYDPSTGDCPLTLKALKVRDGEKPAPLHLIRRRVEIPGEITRYGQPVTSCVIERDGRSREDREAEHAHATEAEQRAADLAVLKAMHVYPSATSINRLRPYVNRRMADVTAAVARILRAGWAIEGERGKPYTVTPAGLDVLNQGDA